MFLKVLFTGFALLITSLFLAYYDIKYGKHIIKRDYYIINSLVLIITLFYGILFSFFTKNFFESKNDV